LGKFKGKEILNYFINCSTNTSAESLNFKIKGFRAQLQGIADIPFAYTGFVPSLVKENLSRHGNFQLNHQEAVTHSHHLALKIINGFWVQQKIQ